MPRRPSSGEIISILLENGFEFASQKGSHCKYKSVSGRVVIVPHPRKDIPIGTLRSIIRQSGLDRSAFGF